MPQVLDEVKELIKEQGKGFEEFKTTVSEEIAELKKKGGVDPVLTERLEKIEKSMDDAIDKKNAIEAKLEAEKKEREDLEARLNLSISKGGPDNEKGLRVLDFNRALKARRRDFQKDKIDDLDEKGYDDYRQALENYLRKGAEELEPEERKTLQISIDPDGGYLVTPDVSGRIVKKVYETSPMRQIASQQNISKDKLEGIEDNDEAGAGYAGERTTSGNADTPQVGRWSIEVFNIDTEPKATSNLLDDADVDIEAWLSDKVSDKFARFENAEFANGSTKIRGITSYARVLDTGAGVAWGSVGYAKTGANGAFNGTNPADKLFDLMGLLKDAYLANARWVTRRSVITLMRKFKDTTGQYLWQPSLVLGQPESFAAHPITRFEDLPALSANGASLFFGDFRAAYQIVDRQGNRVLRDPLTAKPFVKFYTTRRTGGGVINFEAIKALEFAS